MKNTSNSSKKRWSLRNMQGERSFLVTEFPFKVIDQSPRQPNSNGNAPLHDPQGFVHIVMIIYWSIYVQSVARSIVTRYTRWRLQPTSPYRPEDPEYWEIVRSFSLRATWTTLHLRHYFLSSFDNISIFQSGCFCQTALFVFVTRVGRHVRAVSVSDQICIRVA